MCRGNPTLLVEGEANPDGFGHELHAESIADAIADGAGPVSYTHLTLPTSDLV